MACRYRISSDLLVHFICVPCRVGFKGVTICPHCKESMTAMGMDFKIPPRNNDRQWRKVALLVEAGIRVQSGCGCSGPGHIPRTLLDAKDYVDAYAKVKHLPWYNRQRRKAMSMSRRAFREFISRTKPYQAIPNRQL